MSTSQVTIWDEYIETLARTKGAHPIVAASWDNGDVLTIGHAVEAPQLIPGTAYVQNDSNGVPVAKIGAPKDRFRLIITTGPGNRRRRARSSTVTAYVRHGRSWRQVPIQVIPVHQELFSRFKGLLETEALAKKRVLIIGLGSGGSAGAVDLACNGVQLGLIDHDRLEIGNISRHRAPISHVGRLKIHSVSDLCCQKNPYARIRSWPVRIGFDNVDFLRERVREYDLIICASDNRPSRLIINRVCVEERKPLIIAGCFRRAYGGQVQLVRPGGRPCHQCYVELLPEQASDQEIAGREQAEGLAYTDRPVAIEPGLNIDIAPVNHMVCKLAVQELIQGTSTTLDSLDQDLVAPMFLWLNRREAETPYDRWEPLEFNVNGMHILRWYGLKLEPSPHCPVCGLASLRSAPRDQNGFSLEKEEAFVRGLTRP